MTYERCVGGAVRSLEACEAASSETSCAREVDEPNTGEASNHKTESVEENRGVLKVRGFEKCCRESEEELPGFEQSFDVIDEVLARVCARRKVRGDEKDDFESWAMVHLWERRSAVWGRFEGKSSFETYLDKILINLLRDYRISKWGKWRASAAASRLGAVAIELEILVFRERLSAREAIDLMANANQPDAPTRESLWCLLSQLPVRQDRRPCMDSMLLEDVVADDRAMARFSETQHLADERVISQALERAISKLSDSQKNLLKSRYLGGEKVVAIAKRLGRKPTPLYAQLGRALRSVRRSMEAEGVESASISLYLEHGGRRLSVDSAFGESLAS